MASMLPRSTAQCLQRRLACPAAFGGLQSALSQTSSYSSRKPAKHAVSGSEVLTAIAVPRRTIVTHITRPFSTPKSTRSQGSFQPTQPAAQEATPPLPLTNLPYFVRRTPSNQLPIYLVTKAGGTKQETRVRKTEGDLQALRADLLKYLGLEAKPTEVYINQINGHITVKGWRKPEVMQFLLDRRF